MMKRQAAADVARVVDAAVDLQPGPDADCAWSNGAWQCGSVLLDGQSGS